ncbi:MAG: hypothetical protein OXF45_06135 [Candidatus Dadabacteria bacterium]|nr:hypothetical protein [Candidatus Dadabacteria bacterium]
MTTITLNVDDRLIDTARRIAADEHTTLEAKFREWLEGYAKEQQQAKSAEDRAEERRQLAKRAMASIEEISKTVNTGGRKFTREEMNER